MAFVQARMGSTRLPGKVLLNLAGKPVLERVVERVLACPRVDEVVVLTTMNRSDLPIVAWCANFGVRVYCGAEDDVLDRFYQAARLERPDVILRITADCPLMDPKVIEQVVDFFREEDLDYANNTEHESFPDGLDVEVFRFAALEKAWSEAKLGSEREHVTPYMRKNPGLFRIGVFDRTPALTGLRWTLDQSEDWAFIQAIYTHFGDHEGIFGLDTILELLSNKPGLSALNGSIIRNEGYLKSVHLDKGK